MQINYKKLSIVFILLISLLIFAGCSSDTPVSDNNTNDDINTQVNLVEPPDRLVANNTKSNISNNISQNVTNTLDDVLINRMHVYLTTGVSIALKDYMEPKVNKIIQIEEDTFNYTMKEFYLDENGEAQKVDKKFDIVISKNLSSPYDQKYDMKYTITYSDTNEIRTIIYVSNDRKRFNLIERYKANITRYYQTGNYYQIIHNEEANMTHMKNHEVAKADPKGNSGDYTTDTFIRLNDLEETKEFEFVRIGNGDYTKRVSSFASIENRSNDNITAEFYYKGNQIEADPYYHDTLDELKSKISGDLSETYFAPMKFGYVLGTRDFKFTADKIENFTAKDGYPSGQEVLNRHKQIIDFKTLSQVKFDVQEMQYEGMTFLESMGITK